MPDMICLLKYCMFVVLTTRHLAESIVMHKYEQRQVVCGSFIQKNFTHIKEQCLSICNTDTMCTSVTFNYGSNVCELFTNDGTPEHVMNGEVSYSKTAVSSTLLTYTTKSVVTSYCDDKATYP